MRARNKFITLLVFLSLIQISCGQNALWNESTTEEVESSISQVIFILEMTQDKENSFNRKYYKIGNDGTVIINGDSVGKINELNIDDLIKPNKLNNDELSSLKYNLKLLHNNNIYMCTWESKFSNYLFYYKESPTTPWYKKRYLLYNQDDADLKKNKSVEIIEKDGALHVINLLES